MDAGYQPMHGDASVEKSNTRLMENYKKWHRMVLITQDGQKAHGTFGHNATTSFIENDLIPTKNEYDVFVKEKGQEHHATPLSFTLFSLINLEKSYKS